MTRSAKRMTFRCDYSSKDGVVNADASRRASTVSRATDDMLAGSVPGSRSNGDRCPGSSRVSTPLTPLQTGRSHRPKYIGWQWRKPRPTIARQSLSGIAQTCRIASAIALGVFHRDQHPAARLEQFRGGAGGGADDRRAARHGLKYRQAKAFLARAEQPHIALP